MSSKSRSINSASVVAATRDNVSSEITGEAVILNFKSGTYFGLDSVGTRIWNIIQTPTKVYEVRDALVSEYDVDPEQCEHDLLHLLNEMKNMGLIEVVHGKAL